MKTIFDKNTREELIHPIKQINQCYQKTALHADCNHFCLW